MFGKAWRLIVMVPVFGVYLIIARWRLWRKCPIKCVSAIESGAILLCCPPDLVMMYAHVFGIWEPDLTRFIARRLHEGDGFIDIGANVGYYSLAAAKVVGDTGTVVSVEASRRIFEMLIANIERNADIKQRIRTVHVAASAEPGELTVHLGPEHNLGLTTTSPRGNFTSEAAVQALPLHDILHDDEITRTRLVKIDVEGGEDQVLAGMREFIERCPKTVEILVEVTPRWWTNSQCTLQQVLQPLLDAGFHAYALPNNYWPWRYLWPRDVCPPQRIHHELDRPIRRLDLVLSRVDAEQL